MNLIKRLDITILAGLLWLLISGCQDQSEQSMQPPRESSAAGQETQPSEREAGKAMTEPEESTAGQETQPSEGEADKTMTEKERMEKEQPSFSQLDTDGNNAISEEEAQTFDPLDSTFREFDRNQDGKIDSEEFRAFKAFQMRGFDHGGDSTVEYGEKGAIEQPSESESERMERQQ